MEYTKENTQQLIKEVIKDNFKTELESLYKNLTEYRNIKKEHDLNYIIDYISEIVLYGNEKNMINILNGSDECDFNLYDKLSFLVDIVEEKNTNYLINYIKHYREDEVYKLFSDDYFETDYLIEDLKEIFDLKGLYDYNIFSYCSSYSGSLFFNSQYINKFDVEELKGMDVEESLDFLHDVIYDHNIKILFSIFVYDKYSKVFVMEMPQEDIKHEEKRVYVNSIEELNKRLKSNQEKIKELEKTKTNSDYLEEIKLNEITSLLHENNNIKEVLK